MKKSLVLVASALLAFGFTSCGNDEIFVLGNIPYVEFFENEADSFDALSSATVKVANGSLTYGTFHEKADSVENSTFSGITFPVKVSKSALEKSGFTEITDKSGEFDLTTTAKGKTTTLRYSGSRICIRQKATATMFFQKRPHITKRQRSKTENSRSEKSWEMQKRFRPFTSRKKPTQSTQRERNMRFTRMREKRRFHLTTLILQKKLTEKSFLLQT